MCLCMCVCVCVRARMCVRSLVSMVGLISVYVDKVFGFYVGVSFFILFF